MASVPPVYSDPDLNQRRKLPSMTNTGETGIGLHDTVNQSLTDVPTNTGPMAPTQTTTTGGTSRPPSQPAAPALPAGWADAGNGMVRNAATGQMLPTNHPEWQRMLSGGSESPVAGTSAPVTPPTPDPFAASGGGTYFASTGQWVPNNNAAALAAAQTAAGAPGTSTAPATPAAGGQAGAGTEPPPAAPPTVKSAYQSALLKMLTENQENPTINDPALKGQADAFSLAQTRAKERARSSLAERAAAEGGTGTSSGAFGNDLVGLEQAQGENEAGFNAGLVGTELQNRRNQLLQAATLAGNQLTDEEHQALQRELANLDAQIRREGIAQQGALGQGDLALRGELGRGQLNLGLLGQLMQGDQFGKDLGARLGMFNASQNSNYLNALLSQLGA